MSVAEGAEKTGSVRKPGGFLLLVFLPSLIVFLGVAAFGLAQAVATKNADASGYAIDEIVTGAIAPTETAATP